MFFFIQENKYAPKSFLQRKLHSDDKTMQTQKEKKKKKNRQISQKMVQHAWHGKKRDVEQNDQHLVF